MATRLHEWGENRMRRLLTLAALTLCLIAPAAHAQQDEFVRYAAPDGEYSILLPEAPTVETLRSDGHKVKYLDQTPATGTLGEIAMYQRVDSDTGEMLSVRVTTLKADKTFLEGLTNEKITAVLEGEFQGISLDKKKINFSKGSQTLNWGTLTGYNVDKDNRLFFNVAHYLAGLNSITVIKISFNFENRKFRTDYEKIAPSIAYVGR